MMPQAALGRIEIQEPFFIMHFQNDTLPEIAFSGLRGQRGGV
jgi:hypothetical protein